MTTTRGEARHRWTDAEREKLLVRSRAHETVSEAADALYPDFGVTRNALARQLYTLAIRGKAPWLSTSREPRGADRIPTRWMLFTTRQLADAMQQAGASEALVVVAADGTVTAVFTRGKETGSEVLS